MSGRVLCARSSWPIYARQPSICPCATWHRGILDAVLRDEARTLRHCSKLGRTWQHVLRALDGSLEQLRGKLRWIPSHVPESTMRLRPPLDSTGAPLTTVRWRANRLVDLLAKRAAAAHRLPHEALALVSAATDAVRHSAALLGLITHGANNFRCQADSGSADGPGNKRRDSSARKPAPRRPTAPSLPARSPPAQPLPPPPQPRS